MESVCSEHFELLCFKHDLQAELIGTKPRNILKDDAVPTIFGVVLQKLCSYKFHKIHRNTPVPECLY